MAAAACVVGMLLVLSALAPAAGPRGADVVRLPHAAGNPSELLPYNESKLLLLNPEEETITRVNNDGLVDASFGGDGRVKRFFRGVAVDGRGGILLASSGRSSASSSDWDAKVVRLLPSGRPDRSFGTNGVALVDLGGEYDDGNTVAVSPNGRIILGGVRHLSTSSRGPAPGTPAVARLLPSGKIDRSFGHGGVTILPGGGDYGVRNLIPTPSGNVVAEGEGYIGISIWRISRAGSVIRSFGQDGEVELATRTFPSGVKADLLWGEQIGVLPGDRIVAIASGERYVAGELEYPTMIVCLDRRGRVDHTFGRSGWVNLGATGFFELLTILPHGVTLIVGDAANGRQGGNDIVATAIGRGGTPDPGFGPRGTIQFRLPVRATDVTNQGGRAVVLGQREGDDSRLIRFPGFGPR
jgi:uncharacterized delta-60 repeat protein